MSINFVLDELGDRRLAVIQDEMSEIKPFDHSSWFDISSLSLKWFTLYLSSRTSAVAIPPHPSPSAPLTCSVPVGFVRGSILFNLYITPLRSLISFSTVSHLVYDDATQVFLSFIPKKTFRQLSLVRKQLILLFHYGFHQTMTLLINSKLNSF